MRYTLRIRRLSRPVPANGFTAGYPLYRRFSSKHQPHRTSSVGFMTIRAPYATAWSRIFSHTLVISSGGVFFAVACILASFSTQLWQFLLKQGLFLGMATCLAYMPAVTVSPTWHGPRHGLAMGIILFGTGVGGLVWAPVINHVRSEALDKLERHPSSVIRFKLRSHVKRNSRRKCSSTWISGHAFVC